MVYAVEKEKFFAQTTRESSKDPQQIAGYFHNGHLYNNPGSESSLDKFCIVTLLPGPHSFV